MIIDKASLTGPESFFVFNQAFNIAGGCGRTPATVKGREWRIEGIRLLLKGDNLLDLLHRQQDCLLEVVVNKELLPGLFADAFAHRMHVVAGLEDFQAGTLENCRVMDIDGIATIVSMGTNKCTWKSRVYTLPETTTISSAAWELATSRRTPDDSFRYSVKLYHSATAQSGTPLENELPLADQLPPGKLRRADGLNATDVRRLQIEFSADVLNDSYIHELHTRFEGEGHSKFMDASFGRPLLRAVNLLERVPSAYQFHSLNEIMVKCTSTTFLPASSPPTVFTGLLKLPARLTHSEVQNGSYEYIELRASNALSSCEAFLVGHEVIEAT